jgi:outer membrane protein OmpA-like peptidoglycan-associated protein
LFDTDQSKIRSKARPELDKLGKSLEGYKGTVRIYGHTDDRGSAAYNQKLSEERAEAVKDYLVKECGIPGIHLKTKGLARNTRWSPTTVITTVKKTGGWKSLWTVSS